MLNYLTRHVNPTPYISLMPVEMLMHGEGDDLRGVSSQPARLFRVHHRGGPTSTGPERFGMGYGELLFAWSRNITRSLMACGATPTRAFLMLLMERTENAASAEPAVSQPHGGPAPRP